MCCKSVLYSGSNKYLRIIDFKEFKIITYPLELLYNSRCCLGQYNGLATHEVQYSPNQKRINLFTIVLIVKQQKLFYCIIQFRIYTEMQIECCQAKILV